MSVKGVRGQPIHGERMVPPVNDRGWLTWVERDLEGTVHREGPALPPALFHCRLDDQPDHLVPAHLLPKRQGDRPLTVNPACVWTAEGAIASGLSPEIPFADQFALQYSMVWVRDEVSGRIDPFWLGERTVRKLLQIRSGQTLAGECFSSRMLSSLLSAGVLRSSQESGKQARERREARSLATSIFQRRGFAPVRGLLHPFHISALRRYYRYLIRSGELRLGDPQSPKRYVAHNESVARFFHHQLAFTVSALVGEQVKPSYVYVASYQEGADLEKHTDREQCEFSISLCLDFSPEPHKQTAWPLILHATEGTVSVYQGIGDGLLYRGMDVPHSRGSLGAGRTSTYIFFHYVGDKFQGSLD
jgi:hypothetical protein